MSEARELFERAIAAAEYQHRCAVPYCVESAKTYSAVAVVLRQALATQPQPEPGVVPELPEFVTGPDGHGLYRIGMDGDIGYVIDAGHLTPDDLDRIAEACRILAARERARRAQS